MSKIIEITDASVIYRIRNGASSTFKDSIIRSLRRERKDVQVNSLNNVSFVVEEGEILAVIGRNGAGKSTLLKLIARVLPPTSGLVS